MFPAFVLLVSMVVLIFGPLGGKPQVVLIFGAVLSLGPFLFLGVGFPVSDPMGGGSEWTMLHGGMSKNESLPHQTFMWDTI